MSNKIATANGKFSYRLIRKQRKSIGLYIRGGELEVRAPFNAKRSEIESFIRQQADWISKHLRAAKAQREGLKSPHANAVSYGSLQLWRGKSKPILDDSKNTRMWLDDTGFHLPPGLNGELLKHNLIRLYKTYAKKHLSARVQHYAAIMGVSPQTIKITGAKTRWGSCSTSKEVLDKKSYNVNFSWRLCLASDELIDSIVVHELAHIFEMNHSPAFYQIVRAVMPDYDTRRKKLREFGRMLDQTLERDSD
jgi:predicted metal-dependent hydrolase